MSTSSKPLRQPGLIVYLCGVGTSALALWLVHHLNEHHEFNIMGWYLNAIIPGGALIVGIASGIGYAVASRMLQVKLSKAFVFGMITTAIIDYIAAQYLTYTHIIERLHIPPERYGFTDYIREICEGMAFSSRNSAEPGSPLGMWGYLFKLLEMGGYALGAMIPSLAVFGMPYCKKCQQYLKAHRSGHIHSPDQWSNVKKLAKKERLAALQAAVGALTARANQVVAPIAAAPLADTEAAVAALDPAIQKDAAARITFELKKCPRCDAHHLTLNLFNFTVDKKSAVNALAKIDKTESPAPVAA
jgi:hypothetical protein